MTTNATARKIVLDAYRASDRDDLDFEFEPSDRGLVTVLLDRTTALCISDEWETDADGQSQHVGYSWTTWSLEHTEEGRVVRDTEDSWDEGGAPTEVEARAHVAAWLARPDAADLP